MAGAIPITFTDAERAAIRNLDGPLLSLLFMDIDEYGWDVARRRLHKVMARPEFQQQTTHGDADVPS
jgi:hypothetical protein